jgi:ABC-type branched-subunit amino acid transport system permease subunit
MRRRLAVWIVLVLLIAFPLGANIFYSGFYVSLLTRIFIYAIIVVGYDLLAGYKMISYGHAILRHSAYMTGNSEAWTAWFWRHWAHHRSQRVAYIVRFLSAAPGRFISSFLLCLFPVLFVTANSWNFIGVVVSVFPNL